MVMGMISVSVEGSFSTKFRKTYSAMEGGHAFAIQRAIADLIASLPSAIQLDHELSRHGDRPPVSDFGTLAAKD